MRFLLPLLLLAGCAAAEAPASEVIIVKSAAIPLNPKDPAQRTVGRLRYMGGLQLRSDDKRFGGISGLRWMSYRASPGGTPVHPVAELLAVTDAGNWIIFEPREENGRLVGLAKATLGPLNGVDGHPLSSKAEADAEALTLVEDCFRGVDGCVAVAAFVSFERDHRIWRYDLGDEGGPSSVPSNDNVARAWLKRQPRNGGVEAMAGVEPHYVVLFSEGLRDANGKVEGREFYCYECGDSGTERVLGIDLPDPFQPTDADWNPQGLILLSRSFSPMHGVAVRVDMLDIPENEEGIPTISEKPSPIAALKPPLNVDNMEGLAVRQEGGRTFLYIISDDNFSSLQRTVLLKFELMPEPAR